MQKTFLSIFAFMLALFFGHQVSAQDEVVRPYTEENCSKATAALAEMQGQDEKSWSSQDGSEKAYEIWASPECAKIREPRKLDVVRDMDKVVELLAQNNIDVSRDLDAEIAKCDTYVNEKWSNADAKFRSQNSKAELKETCALNARIALYSKALNRLNRNRQNSYDADMAAYERAKQERLDKIAADQAAYEADVAAQKKAHAEAMAKWEREAKLCRSGKREYCAK